MELSKEVENLEKENETIKSLNKKLVKDSLLLKKIIKEKDYLEEEFNSLTIENLSLIKRLETLEIDEISEEERFEIEEEIYIKKEVERIENNINKLNLELEEIKKLHFS